MLEKKVLDALEKQATHEQTNSRVYRMYSQICDKQSLHGATAWFLKQAQEENAHCEMILGYVQDQDETIKYGGIPEISTRELSLTEIFEETLELEKKTTSGLKNVVDVSLKENDHQTYNFISKMLFEQVEEEKTVTDILNRLKLAGDGLGIILMDQELSK